MVVVVIVNSQIQKQKRLNWARRRRERLMHKDPHCHWCGIEVIYYNPEDPEMQKLHGKKMPPNFATLDHLFPRLSPLRHDPQGRAKTVVLACHKCNQERSDNELKNTPKEVLTARSSGNKTAYAPLEIYPEVFGV